MKNAGPISFQQLICYWVISVLSNTITEKNEIANTKLINLIS